MGRNRFCKDDKCAQCQRQNWLTWSVLGIFLSVTGGNRFCKRLYQCYGHSTDSHLNPHSTDSPKLPLLSSLLPQELTHHWELSCYGLGTSSFGAKHVTGRLLKEQLFGLPCSSSLFSSLALDFSLELSIERDFALLDASPLFFTFLGNFDSSRLFWLPELCHPLCASLYTVLRYCMRSRV